MITTRKYRYQYKITLSSDCLETKQFHYRPTFSKMTNFYNANVRVGNWYDEMVMQEEILKKYLHDKQAEKLKVQRARKYFLAVLKEVKLDRPEKGVAFDAVLQILAPLVENGSIRQGFPAPEGKGMALSVYLPFVEIDRRVHFEHGDQVVATPLLIPTARNTWKLIPLSGNKTSGDAVCFGDELAIEFVGAPSPTRLFVDIDVPGPSISRGKAGYPVPRLTQYLARNNRFVVVHVDPSCRYEFEKQPVPPGSPVALLHGPDHRALCVESEAYLLTYFGKDCEVMKHSLTDRLGKHAPQNVWSFAIRPADTDPKGPHHHDMPRENDCPISCLGNYRSL